ncbi:U4/U6 small nuclear ribonucleoprotein Prp3 isoform X1 [Cloeon dipterum]
MNEDNSVAKALAAAAAMAGGGGKTNSSGPGLAIPMQLGEVVGADSALNSKQIEEMMANAKKVIEERKKALTAIKSDTGKPKFGLMDPQMIAEAEKARRIAQLQAQIQEKINAVSINAAVAAAQAHVREVTAKPKPLILDAQGRTVDMEGKEVQLTQRMPTLKANIRAKKREEFKQQLQDKGSEDIAEQTFFDPRIAAKTAIRNKRALKFNEPGKYVALADKMRTKAQLEKLQSEIAQIARKTGITTTTKLALITPTDARDDDVPEVEWWDSIILAEDSYAERSVGKVVFQGGAVTNLVEHPTQMRAPTDPLRPIYMPVFLTKKERKKIRRQNRRETWKEEQEKIRLGLEPAPEPKLRITNLMRVLGTEAVQDPTKIEAHVREQMAKRQKAHEDANAARKLTPEERRLKKIKKMKEDTTLGVQVAVFRVRDLSNPSKKFKVETNAKQLFMTGTAVIFKDCNVIIVEGGPKQMKKYKRLMLNRIKWEEDNIKDGDGNEVPNKCVLVWEGSEKSRSFSGDIKFKLCPTERVARELFKKHKVEQHWDLAYSGAVLETAQDAG